MAVALVVVSVSLAGCASSTTARGREPTHSREKPTKSPERSAKSAPTPTTDDWLVYHHDPGGTGVAAAADLSPAHQAWVSPMLDGQLYGEPLVAGSTVIVATENDTVYALNATNGQVVWSTHVGNPVPASSLPCGDITPTVGITSTPVIDLARDEVFVVADEEGATAPEHVLVGLNLKTGAVMLSQGVDPPNVDTADILQRVALTLDNGDVVFGYGGNYGLCTYNNNGWVFSVPETGGAPTTYEFDAQAGNSLGGVWMGGAAPIVDSQGNIWVGVGNGSVTAAGAAYDGSDSVVEFSSSLSILQYFAPSDWANDNAHDLDLGSSSPALLSNGLIVQAGKSHTAYLLNSRALGGIGGQLDALGSFCATDVDGGDAVQGSVVYMPCQSGVIAVAVTSAPPSLQVEWQTTSGSGGPPIVAGGEIWTISQSGALLGLDPSNGAVVQQFDIGSVANHFPTPSFGDGVLLAPATDQVFAFSGP
jgi:outer membrane protein assembly factor BamB